MFADQGLDIAEAVLGLGQVWTDLPFVNKQTSLQDKLYEDNQPGNNDTSTSDRELWRWKQQQSGNKGSASPVGQSAISESTGRHSHHVNIYLCHVSLSL